MEKQTKGALHEGHRSRMRERVARSGAGALADHELLEMLLYYVHPRRDTNETAHELIEECGSLSAVLEAPEERLCRVNGVKENTAIYLQLLSELSRRYVLAKTQSGEDPMQVVYDDRAKIASLMYPRFLGLTTERMYAILFDSAMRLLDVFCVSEGTANAVSVTVRKVAQRAYQRNAVAVVLAHNHPGGIASPSLEDIHLTKEMESALLMVGVPLVEHFVFTERAYYPILASCGEVQQNDTPEALRAAQLRRLLDKKN